MLFSDNLNAIMLFRRSENSFVAQRSVASIIELFWLYYLVIIKSWLFGKSTSEIIIVIESTKLCCKYTHHHVPKTAVEFGLCHLFNLKLFIVVMSCVGCDGTLLPKILIIFLFGTWCWVLFWFYKLAIDFFEFCKLILFQIKNLQCYHSSKLLHYLFFSIIFV